MLTNLLTDSLTAFPFLGWALLAILILGVQIISKNAWVALSATLGGLLVLIVYSIWNFDPAVSVMLFHGAVVFDSLSQIFNLLGLGIATAVILTLIPGLQDSNSQTVRMSYEQFPEFLVCLLLSGFGLSILGSAFDLTALFLGLEILSIGIYCLCGFFRTEIRSTESAFKYLMIGAFSTAIFLYGVAFIYGSTGSTNYPQIFMEVQKGITPLLSLGMLFLMAGFGFKLAFVPFHLYTPDVYEGAPTPVTGYLATIVKVGALAGALRVFCGFLSPVSQYWIPIWLTLSILSILIGNIVALQQRTIKKLLAFSSISHAGFIGLGLVIAKTGNSFPVLSYLFVYSAMTLGAFAILTFIENRERVFLVDDLRGLGQKKFLLSFIFSIFMLGFAGIPPLAGFMIKFWVLQALIQQGYMTVAIIAIIGSLIGAAYYLRILMLMFMSEGTAISREQGSIDRLFSLRIVVALTTIITIIGGLRPQLYADWLLSSLVSK